MQNVQNAAEIQQRVINLVELYRTKVGKESQIAKDAKADYAYWEDESVNMMVEAGLSVGCGMYSEGPHTEVWIKHLKVNEQLLGHFYAEVAGEKAEKEVLDQLLPEIYDKTIFTKEEEDFLKMYFKELVNYIVLTPCDLCLKYVHIHDSKDAFTVPSEVLELIKSRVEIARGSKIFNPNTGFAQFTSLYEGCKYFCDSKNAWMKVLTLANNADVEILENKILPRDYDAVISYPANLSDKGNDVEQLCKAYDSLQPGGMFVLLCHPRLLTDETNSSLRNRLVKDKAIREIIQLPQVMSSSASFDTYCVIIAEKGRKDGDTTLIDAQRCQKIENNERYLCSFDMTEFNAILQNNGKDPNTGFRNLVKVSSDKLSSSILLPQVYTVERPLEVEQPVPLSTLCSIESTIVRDVHFNLPEDTPWITISDITPLFSGEMNMSDIRKADCPNNPPYIEGNKDYAFDEYGKFVDSIWVQMNTKKGHHVLEYRQCTFLDGSNDVVLYKNGSSAKLVLKKRSAEHGVGVAVVRATNKPFAVSNGILVFRPKNGFDAQTLAAMLRLPIVSRQLLVYEQFGIGLHLDDILVPTDKRIIGDELYRMKREESVTKELEDNYTVAQKKYKAKLEDYQHAMRKHIREISSSVRRMERFINDMNSSDEGKKFLIDRLAVIKSHRLYLSEDIERLNEENTYGEASPFDIDYCLRSYREYFGSDVCTIKYTNEIANEAIRKYLKDHQAELKELDEKSRYKNIEMASTGSSLAYVDIAEYNFGKIVRNILENAKKHGFDDFIDVNRKDFYVANQIIGSFFSIV